MKKLTVLVVVAVLGIVAWKMFGPPNMERAAKEFSALCGSSADDISGDKFEQLIGGLPKRAAYDCVMDADSCADATGCLSALHVRENLRGMQRALQ